MDQPPQQPQINTEGVLAWALGAIATLGAIAVRGRFRIKAMREKVEAESAPQIEKEYLEANEKITAAWQLEVDKLRAQIDKIRGDSREELSSARAEQLEWMKRALTCESTTPALKAEIDLLNRRVQELEKQVAEARNHRGDIR
jgi:predicted  nucleic acid-binding Zn-ribbon protein